MVWSGWIGALIINIVSGYGLYSYLISQETEEKKWFWAKEWNVRLVVFEGICMLIGLLIYGYSKLGTGETFIKSCLNMLVFLLIAGMGYIDWKERIIPNKMIFAGFVLWLSYIGLSIVIDGVAWKEIIVFSLIGGGVSGGFLLIIALVMGSALGMGDVKMFAIIGLIYGLSSTYLILLVAVIIMAIVSIGLLLLRKATRKTAIPMAPFVAFSFVFCIFAGM